MFKVISMLSLFGLICTIMVLGFFATLMGPFMAWAAMKMLWIVAQAGAVVVALLALVRASQWVYQRFF